MLWLISEGWSWSQIPPLRWNYHSSQADTLIHHLRGPDVERPCKTIGESLSHCAKEEREGRPGGWWKAEGPWIRLLLATLELSDGLPKCGWKSETSLRNDERTGLCTQTNVAETKAASVALQEWGSAEKITENKVEAGAGSWRPHKFCRTGGEGWGHHQEVGAPSLQESRPGLLSCPGSDSSPGLPTLCTASPTLCLRSTKPKGTSWHPAHSTTWNSQRAMWEHPARHAKVREDKEEKRKQTGKPSTLPAGLPCCLCTSEPGMLLFSWHCF